MKIIFNIFKKSNASLNSIKIYIYITSDINNNFNNILFHFSFLIIKIIFRNNNFEHAICCDKSYKKILSIAIICLFLNSK